MSDEYRQELYEERAEWASLESDISRGKQLTFVGGFWWRLFSWFEDKARQERALVQADIDNHMTRRAAVDEIQRLGEEITEQEGGR